MDSSFECLHDGLVLKVLTEIGLGNAMELMKASVLSKRFAKLVREVSALKFLPGIWSEDEHDDLRRQWICDVLRRMERLESFSAHDVVALRKDQDESTPRYCPWIGLFPSSLRHVSLENLHGHGYEDGLRTLFHRCGHLQCLDLGFVGYSSFHLDMLLSSSSSSLERLRLSFFSVHFCGAGEKYSSLRHLFPSLTHLCLKNISDFADSCEPCALTHLTFAETLILARSCRPGTRLEYGIGPRHGRIKPGLIALCHLFLSFKSLRSLMFEVHSYACVPEEPDPWQWPVSGAEEKKETWGEEGKRKRSLTPTRAPPPLPITKLWLDSRYTFAGDPRQMAAFTDLLPNLTALRIYVWTPSSGSGLARVIARLLRACPLLLTLHLDWENQFPFESTAVDWVEMKSCLQGPHSADMVHPQPRYHAGEEKYEVEDEEEEDDDGTAEENGNVEEEGEKKEDSNEEELEKQEEEHNDEKEAGVVRTATSPSLVDCRSGHNSHPLRILVLGGMGRLGTSPKGLDRIFQQMPSLQSVTCFLVSRGFSVSSPSSLRSLALVWYDDDDPLPVNRIMCPNLVDLTLVIYAEGFHNLQITCPKLKDLTITGRPKLMSTPTCRCKWIDKIPTPTTAAARLDGACAKLATPIVNNYGNGSFSFALTRSYWNFHSRFCSLPLDSLKSLSLKECHVSEEAICQLLIFQLNSLEALHLDIKKNNLAHCPISFEEALAIRRDAESHLRRDIFPNQGIERDTLPPTARYSSCHNGRGKRQLYPSSSSSSSSSSAAGAASCAPSIADSSVLMVARPDSGSMGPGDDGTAAPVPGKIASVSPAACYAASASATGFQKLKSLYMSSHFMAWMEKYFKREMLPVGGSAEVGLYATSHPESGHHKSILEEGKPGEKGSLGLSFLTPSLETTQSVTSTLVGQREGRNRKVEMKGWCSIFFNCPNLESIHLRRCVHEYCASCRFTYRKSKEENEESLVATIAIIRCFLTSCGNLNTVAGDVYTECTEKCDLMVKELSSSFPSANIQLRLHDGSC
ncbi:hypothetical protein CBR_g39662 [Chara braunii]|uniref:F-box domain-containing protein n=1 Tax=Chara braunii TaxID=69332 RepID=A0A388K1F3_CHABU|nr:hypothetical protein CBR_g39662 [Chara braunii]|eukprot:GBG63881.1 hypothetical protein CBR_g39662 [Chara braunii]